MSNQNDVTLGTIWSSTKNLVHKSIDTVDRTVGMAHRTVVYMDEANEEWADEARKAREARKKEREAARSKRTTTKK